MHDVGSLPLRIILDCDDSLTVHLRDHDVARTLGPLDNLAGTTIMILMSTQGMKVENDLLAKIRAARRRLATDGPIRVRSAGDFERVSIGKLDGDVLRDLVLAERARTVIEIGLAYGGSALAIAEALAANESGQGRHLIIDAY